jgi:hypothetical protein
MEVGFGVVTTGDTGLIRDNYEFVVLLTRVSCYIKDSVDEVEILSFMHMAVINIDHAITVKENSRLQHQLARSGCAISVLEFASMAKTRK